jgi:hypothetical protein
LSRVFEIQQRIFLNRNVYEKNVEFRNEGCWLLAIGSQALLMAAATRVRSEEQKANGQKPRAKSGGH